MSAACKTLQSRGGIQMSGANAAEDDIDFDFLVSFNNTSYMALVNAAQEKSVCALAFFSPLLSRQLQQLVA